MSQFVCGYLKNILKKIIFFRRGIDVKKENFDNYDIGNIKDISNSFY